MRAVLEKLSSINAKKLLKCSVIILIVGILLGFVIPTIVYVAVKHFTVLKPGHFVRQKMEYQIPMTYKLYLWNVTNPHEIIAGTAKPKMKDVGPYVFSLIKRKVETADNQTEDTYTFDTINRYNFDSHLSAPLTGDEALTLMNIVLAPGILKAKMELPHLLDLAIEGMDRIFKNPKSIFVDMTAIEFIETGMPIDCNQTSVAAKAVCREMRKFKHLSIVDGDKTRLRFRWFDILNSTKEARYTVKRGSKNTREIGRILTVDDKSVLNSYKTEECNQIRGSEKMSLPPFQKRDDVLWVYSHMGCASVSIVHKYMKTKRGVRASFKTLESLNSLGNPACNCNSYFGCNNISGTYDMHACYKVFLLGSFPHFYSATPNIVNAIDGMKPEKRLHETGMYLDLYTGAPIVSMERFQINAVVKRIPEYPLLSSIAAEGVYIPILWFEENFRLTNKDLTLVIITKSIKALEIPGYILTCLGAISSSVAVFLTLQAKYTKKELHA